MQIIWHFKLQIRHSSPAPLATTLAAALAFADHVTKCCILIGWAKKILITYAENGHHIENSACDFKRNFWLN